MRQHGFRSILVLAMLLIAGTTSAQTTTPEPTVEPIKNYFGVVLGSPALLNFTYSTFANSKYGFGVSAGLFPLKDEGLVGLELNFMRRFGIREHTEHAYGLQAGVMRNYEKNATGVTLLYAGPAYYLTWRKMYVLVGVTLAHENDHGCEQKLILITTNLGLLVHRSR